MLVKVLNKATQKEALISQRAYELAKKRYNFIGHVEDDYANTTTPKKQEAPKQAPQTQTASAQNSQVDQSPNPTTTAKQETAGDAEKVAGAVVSKPQQEKKKPGRKAKSISSPTATVEV